MGRAIALVAIVVLSACLIFMLVAPHLLPPQPTPPTAVHVVHAAQPDTRAPVASIAVPRSADETRLLTLEQRRAPYYGWIRESEGARIVDARANATDPATLDLYLVSTDEGLLRAVLASVVQPYAAQYGFDRARFLVPAPADAVDRYYCAAEASPDDARTWHAFFK